LQCATHGTCGSTGEQPFSAVASPMQLVEWAPKTLVKQLQAVEMDPTKAVA
jgi:hypothetical protein